MSSPSTCSIRAPSSWSAASVWPSFNAMANQIPAPVPPIVVDQAWVENHLKNYVRRVVREHERNVAEQAALSAIVAPTDIT